jgi:tetratricopeptide (TPR) repeat protein
MNRGRYWGSFKADLRPHGVAVMKSCATDFAITETDRVLRERCELALEDALTNRGNPLRDVDRVLSEDSRFVFGHCLRAALIVRADDAASQSRLIASVTAIEVCPDAGDLARRHASAAHAWLYGDPALAAERYGAILSDYPRDILALFVAHALDFRLGQRHMLRDRVAQVLPEWEVSQPYYASVLAMYAFGLEETGQYRHAEEAARRALAFNARHPGAIHVIAHVLEMQGRAREGLEFLEANESAWIDATGISVHLAWHRALFHLDADDPASALAVYDAQIVRSHAVDMSQLADASALLWRLQLRNIRIGERWQSLADRWEKQQLAGARLFYVTHAMMALAAAGRTASVERILNGLPHVETRGNSISYQEEALILPLCKALLAFANSDYIGCVGLLKRVRHLAHRCGGSLAQCDLVHLTLTEAALRAHKANLARALVAERAAMKPTSRLNQRLLRRLA